MTTQETLLNGTTLYYNNLEMNKARGTEDLTLFVKFEFNEMVGYAVAVNRTFYSSKDFNKMNDLVQRLGVKLSQ